jgi:hypothetical protein
MEATCGQCGGKVTVGKDGKVVRQCGHDFAAIKVDCSAKLYGEMALASGHPEALKLQKTG